MERKEVEIRDAGGGKVGAIVFDENPPLLNVTRTGTGINLTIPAEVELRWPNRDEPRPSLTNLRIIAYMRDPKGQEIELCRIRDDDYYEAASPQGTSQAKLIWTDALRGIIFIESMRSGNGPQLEIIVRGELCYIVKCAEAPDPQDQRIIVRPLRYEVRTAPRVRLSERIAISFPTEVWEKMVQTAFALSQDDPYLLALPLYSFFKQKR
jgi:hypothetical protein